MILDKNEITHEMLIQRLRDTEAVHEDIEKLRISLETVYNQYKWSLEAEDRQIAQRDAVLTTQEKLDAALYRTQSLMHYKRVKRQILQAIKEAEEADRLKKEADAEAEKMLILKKKENMWKHRILH